MTVAHDHDLDQPAVTNIGAVIREAREAARMTQAELGLAVRVSSRSIGSYERGAVEPPLGLLPVLGRALGVRFVADTDGRYSLEPASDAAPVVDAPRVVVLVAGTPEAMREALDRLGVPRAE